MPRAEMVDKASFLTRYGGIFEHSPWIAAQVWDLGLHGGGLQKIYVALADVIRNADHEQQLALLRAHPQLASAIANGEELTTESRGEQHEAGLDQCSEVEYEEFQHLNSTYSDKFDFPFIIAVKGLGREQILESFRTRLANTPEEEFTEALEQVIRIGKFRLQNGAETTGSDS